MSTNIIINTANTLSINASPGQQKRYPSVAQESIFTFGDFKIQRNISQNILSAQTPGLSFSNFGTLSSLSPNNFDSSTVINTTINDLNLKKNDSQSYAYFGSFYTKVATAINNIIENFPYAILANSTGSTIVNYSNSWSGTSIFSIPVSALTNQGNIIYTSGVTTASTMITLFNDFDLFEIELSSTTIYQNSYTIKNYTFNYTGSTLDFEINGYLFTATTLSSTTLAVYIKPSKERYYQYKQTLSNLEYQLLFEQKFLVPDADTGLYENTDFIYPKTIDGFNPDSYGSALDAYISSILTSATNIDETKTGWMVRTMLPENYLELDTDSQIYRKITSVYAEEFDKIKLYIDSLAYAHSVNYQNEQTIPDKFLHRLSTLLGWEPINEFNEADIFEFLAREDSDGKTVSEYNLNLWKRILININWLYKKKGTRDALEFIFKLMGAPDCLVHFNELTYQIRQASTAITTSDKINEHGYINFDSSKYIFQEGGDGRGNGDAFIRQWEPEFNPKRLIDNIKVITGNTDVYGTENIINSKQVNIELSPAAAIECDVQDWYNVGFLTASTANLPSYIDYTSLQIHVPASISAMTMSQWLDYVYTNSIDPRRRKTVDPQAGHSFFYKHLKDIYLAYYYWNTTNQQSSRLTFRKLETFLDLIQRNFGAYIERLIPATTIIESQGTLYRNTIFNRQKFVYPEGINAGSEFQIKAPLAPDLILNVVFVNSRINDILNPEINAVSATGTLNNIYEDSINTVEITNNIDTGIHETINAVIVSTEIMETNTIVSAVLPEIRGIVSGFPPEGIPQAQPPIVARPYKTKTGTDVAESSDAAGA